MKKLLVILSMLVCFLFAGVTLQAGAASGAAKKDGNPAGVSQQYKCGKKTKCSQMTSCEEARFYLNTCGVKRLDRDHDGIPCEKLCK